MKQKKLLIHVGVHQTGTASIQKMLSDNASHLAARGILYPPFETAPGAKVVNHQRLAWKLLDKKVGRDELKGWAASLEKAEADTLVLSAQDLCRLHDVSFLEAFVGIFDVEMALYVRRQDDWVNAWYNVNVKWPLDAKLCRCDPVEFLKYLDDFHWIRYFDVAERWAKYLGHEHVHIRVMEAGQVEDAVADFCALAGISQEPGSHLFREGLQEDALNANLPAEQLELLRRLGTLGYPNAVRTKIGNAVRKAGGAAGTNVYSREIRQLIVDQYAVQNQKLAKEFLQRADAVLFRNREFPAGPPERDTQDKRSIIAFIRGIIEEFSSGGGGT